LGSALPITGESEGPSFLERHTSILKDLGGWIVDHYDRRAVFVTPNIDDDGEAITVWNDGVAPHRTGKGFSPGVTDRFALLGQSLGIIDLVPVDRGFFHPAARWLAGWLPAGSKKLSS
jgi:hypothetical protein